MRRMKTGANPDQNSPMAKQIRSVPIDITRWQLYTYANPQIQGEEDFRPIKRMGLEQLQDTYVEKFKVNKTRRDLELFNCCNRRQILRNDVSQDHLPVFTMNSPWFRESQEKMAARNGGKGRVLFNVGREYGQ